MELMEIIAEIIVAPFRIVITILSAAGFFGNLEIVGSDDPCWDVEGEPGFYEDENKIVWYSDGRMKDECF